MVSYLLTYIDEKRHMLHSFNVQINEGSVFPRFNKADHRKKLIILVEDNWAKYLTCALKILDAIFRFITSWQKKFVTVKANFTYWIFALIV